MFNGYINKLLEWYIFEEPDYRVRSAAKETKNNCVEYWKELNRRSSLKYEKNFLKYIMGKSIPFQ